LKWRIWIKNLPIEQVGITEDGKAVIKGVFKLFDTYGIPLWVICESFQKNNWIPSWVHFYWEASEHGWTHKTIISKLKDHLADIYELEFISTVTKRLNELEKKLNEKY